MFNFKKNFNKIANIDILKSKLKQFCYIIGCSSLLLMSPSLANAESFNIDNFNYNNIELQYVSVNEICMEATAYSGDESGSITASGYNIYDIVGWGCASNDFPIGTELYIECPSAPWINGIYTVLDTGGMGSGVIDIAMNNIDECYDFGRRTIYVTVLN